jgi:hypothetical protein
MINLSEYPQSAFEEPFVEYTSDPRIEDRCAPRVRTDIPALIRVAGGQKIHVAVRDLAIAGFSCEVVMGSRPGTLCWLTLPGLAAQEAEIVWNSGHMVGCAFRNLLNRAVLDSVLARHR